MVCLASYLSPSTLLMHTRNERVSVFCHYHKPASLYDVNFHASAFRDGAYWLTSENASVSQMHQWVAFRDTVCLMSTLSGLLPPPTCQSSKGFRGEIHWCALSLETFPKTRQGLDSLQAKHACLYGRYCIVFLLGSSGAFPMSLLPEQDAVT